MNIYRQQAGEQKHTTNQMSRGMAKGSGDIIVSASSSFEMYAWNTGKTGGTSLNHSSGTPGTIPSVTWSPPLM